MADQTVTTIAAFNALTGVEVSAGDTVKINGFLEGELVAGFSGTSGTPSIITNLNSNADGSFGDGDGDFPEFTTSDEDYLTIEDLTFRGASSVEFTASQCVKITSGSTGITLKRLSIGETPTKTYKGSGDGIRSEGDGNFITDLTIRNVNNDGIFNIGATNEFSHLDISNVSRRTGGFNGDCLKFSSTGDCSDCHAHHNIFDHTSTRDKAPHIMSGDASTTGMLGEYNKYMGGQRSILMKGFAQVISRRGLVQPGDHGPKHGDTGEIITDTTGIRLESNTESPTYLGHLVESMVIESVTLNRKPNNAIFTINGDHVIRGCTIVCDVNPLDSAGDPVAATAYAQVLFNTIGSALAGTTFQNNIVMGPNNTSLTYFISTSEASRVPDVMDNNVYIGLGRWLFEGTPYTTFAEYQTAASPLEANSQHLTLAQADDVFVDWQNGDFRIKDSQSVMTAVGAEVSYKDINGVDQPTTRQIGAYALELAETPVQYPAWGRKTAMIIGYQPSFPTGSDTPLNTSSWFSHVVNIGEIGTDGLELPEITKNFVIREIVISGASSSGSNPAELQWRMYDADRETGTPLQRRPSGGNPVLASGNFVVPAGMSEATHSSGPLSISVSVSTPITPIIVFRRNASFAGINIAVGTFTFTNPGPGKRTTTADDGVSWTAAGTQVAGYAVYSFGGLALTKPLTRSLTRPLTRNLAG